MLTIAQESWTQILPELQGIIVQHWEEIALSKDKIKLRVNWDTYSQFDAKGILKCLSVRDHGKLVGYFIGFVVENPHYMGYKLGQTDVYYILPYYRKGRIGLRLFQAVEKMFRAEGCVKMVTATKLHFDHSNLFEHLGWNRVEVTYTKELI